jgi:hypothetical protein
MRTLSSLLALLLLCVLGTAATAQASLPPLTDPVRPFVVDEEEAESDATEDEEAESGEEFCELDEEDFCVEEEPEPKGKDKGKGEECLLKSASAALTANPGKRQLRLTVHYRTLSPATVSVEASLESPKGVVHLGSDHARFRLSGVYRDTYELPEKQMKKAATARGFSVELHVLNSPASCRVELTGPSRLAKR